MTMLPSTPSFPARRSRIRAVLTDIEGTTSSIHFVHQVLFPYSAAAMPEFVATQCSNPAVQPWLAQVAAELHVAPTDLAVITAELSAMIAQDRKHTALKALQGMIWRRGYQSGAFKAHLYSDVAPKLAQWAQTRLVYVYSSGSIAAQKLFFAHSDAGDLSALLRGYFDTTSGGKREAASYTGIARAIGVIPGEIVFLSDIEAELDAARGAGLRTVLLARDAAPAASAHTIAHDFTEITL
jgi:enolase-phosphatase E1